MKLSLPHSLTVFLGVWESALCSNSSQRTTPSVLYLESAVPSSRFSSLSLKLVLSCAYPTDINKIYGTNDIGGTGSMQSEAAWLVPICLQLTPASALIVG